MKEKIKLFALSTKLTQEEFDNMRDGINKGIISFKSVKNDNITALALSLETLFSIQSAVSNENRSQKIISSYLEANSIAGKLLKEITPVVKSIEDKRRANKRKK